MYSQTNLRFTLVSQCPPENVQIAFIAIWLHWYICPLSFRDWIQIIHQPHRKRKTHNKFLSAYSECVRRYFDTNRQHLE